MTFNGFEKLLSLWCRSHGVTRKAVIEAMDRDIKTSAKWVAARKYYSRDEARILHMVQQLRGLSLGEIWPSHEELRRVDATLYLPEEWLPALAAGGKCITAGQGNKIPADEKKRRHDEAVAMVATVRAELPDFVGEDVIKKEAAKRVDPPCSVPQFYRRLRPE